MDIRLELKQDQDTETGGVRNDFIHFSTKKQTS